MSSNCRILIIEDDQENLSILDIGARLMGFDAVAKKSILEVIEDIIDFTQFHGVICDKGASQNLSFVVEQMKLSNPQLVVFLISGDAKPVEDQSFDCFYQKPFKMQEMFADMTRMLNSRQ